MRVRPQLSSSSGLLVTLLLTTWTARAQTCENYGLTASSGSGCECPPGWTNSSSCYLPACGGNLANPGSSTASLTSDSFKYGNVSSCSCDSGWAGPACTVCTSTSACAAAFPGTSSTTSSASSGALNTTVVCNDSPRTYASAQMSCNVLNPTLQSLFNGSSVLTITKTVDPTQSPKGFGANGTMYAQLWYNGVEQFYCKANGCNQTLTPSNNGSIYTCSNLDCHCRNGTTFCSNTVEDLSPVINTLNGQLIITCDPPSSSGQGSCTFAQTLLKQLFGNVGLQLSSCAFGECVQQYVIDQAEGVIATVPTASKITGGVIAGLAVVGVLLLLILGLIFVGWVSQRRARQVPYDPLTAGQSDERRGAGVEWNNIGYQIIGHKHQMLTRRLSGWMKGQSGANEDVDGRVVLEGVSGKLPVGGFLAVLGPSGAGKSTFVDILAGRRKTAGKVSGNVRYFSASTNVTHRVGYVDQSDVLSPTSTVKEALTFAARLRLPENTPEEVMRERVFEVMAQLGLTDIGDTIIGSGERRGISGGEMRRVSIGLELIAAPEVLIADEPTSGLDSVSAARVVSVLKDLSTNPKRPTTIIASIHQPNSRLYSMFDTVLLLADGKQLYFGPGGSAPAAYFAEKGRPCPEQYNVADHLLEIASAPHGDLRPKHVRAMSSKTGVFSGDEKEHLPTLAINGSGSSHGDQSPPSLSLEADAGAETINSATTRRCETTFLTQLQVLSAREWRNLKRDKTLLLAHLIFSAILGVFAGGLYFKVNLTIAGFQNRIGSLFFCGSLIAFSSLSALYNLVDIRPLFLRERAASFYSPFSWLLTRVVFDVIPIRLIPTIITSTIVYFMVGLSHSGVRYLKFELILLEFSLAITLFNLMLACLWRNGGVAILLSSLYNLYLMTYAGFFVNLHQIPPVLRWLRWFDVLGYSLEALSVNEVTSGLVIKDSLAGVPVDISAELIMTTLFGFGVNNYYRDVLVLFAFIAGYAVILVGVVYWRLREAR